jgi:deoxycytidylate deaminase
MLINAGISRVVVKRKYPDEDGIQMLKDSGVTVHFLEK